MKDNFLQIPPIKPQSYQEFSNVINPQILLKYTEQKEYLSRFDMWEYLRRVFLIHWVIKLHFNSKYKLPMSRLEIKETKALGTLYADVFTACLLLHPSTFDEYRNAAQWFSLIMIEKRVEGINKGTKAKSLEGIRKENKKLMDYENPFEEDFPHTFRLFEILVSLPRDYDVLQKKALDPIKKSRKAWATAYCDPAHQVGDTRDGIEYRQMPKQGSGMKKLPVVATWDQLRDGLKIN